MAKPRFNSNNFHFRPTSLSEAMQQAGLTKRLHMVREPKQSITATKENNKGERTWAKERVLPVRSAA